jgi:serine/threonine protein kinase HipA of HipAB toxin-antitoxin module
VDGQYIIRGEIMSLTRNAFIDHHPIHDDKKREKSMSREISRMSDIKERDFPSSGESEWKKVDHYFDGNDMTSLHYVDM